MELDYVQKLGDALRSQSGYHEPWATGTVTLSDPDTSFCFKCKDGTGRFVDLKSIGEEDIAALINACDPAPFGRGSESVLDETYRRAWKLDDGSFIWRFNPDSSKFVTELAQRLCPWDSLKNGIRAEPYKLNVYGQGGFFKTHQDTPRAENMFGTLVVVLPIYHQGGNLVLRHAGRQLDFNAPALLDLSPPGTIAWTAFYSDVEHEVLEVTQGTRITVTFNLYFDSHRISPIPSEQTVKIPENPFTIALREAFYDAGFIREHQYLGFGLQHTYPREPTSSDLWDIKNCFKGPDAFLYRILDQIGLKPSVRYLYDNSCRDSDFWVLLSKPVIGRDEDDRGYEMEITQLSYLFESDKNARIVWKPGQSEERLMEEEDYSEWQRSYLRKDEVEEYRERTADVGWVVPPTANLAGFTEFTELGNDPAQEIFYFHVCIVVNVRNVPYGCARFVNLKSFSEEDITALINACDPAPFGRGTESVLDETYRRALKLDDGDFVWRFTPDSGKFVAELAQRLCPWDTFDNGIRAEPYKLNIYGQGGFFKAHQDTPRAENMFGSLVVVLPTYHQGGNLLLRHAGRQLDFNAPKMLESSAPGTIAWVAFYSDVEHEVVEVTNGTRVSITFNLYFDSYRSPPVLPEGVLKVPENPFTVALREAFRDASFIRNHQYLGFGLQHEYPREPQSGVLWGIQRCFKGPDVFLYRVLIEVGLNPSVRYLYGGAYARSDFWVLLSIPVAGRDEDETGTSIYDMEESQLEHLMDSYDAAMVVWKPGVTEKIARRNRKSAYWNECYFSDQNYEEYRNRTINVNWVVPPTTNLGGCTKARETGNEPVQETFYFRVCIIVDISEVPCPSLESA
ncbi:hypothetical protein AN958_10013 [Leucoagaricus sp. SymC.cos]|nr:hypothetical protein AN958_10013 [Leucoagaricus sp. SymC.cos]